MVFLQVKAFVCNSDTRLLLLFWTQKLASILEWFAPGIKSVFGFIGNSRERARAQKLSFFLISTFFVLCSPKPIQFGFTWRDLQAFIKVCMFSFTMHDFAARDNRNYGLLVLFFHIKSMDTQLMSICLSSSVRRWPITTSGNTQIIIQMQLNLKNTMYFANQNKTKRCKWSHKQFDHYHRLHLWQFQMQMFARLCNLIVCLFACLLANANLLTFVRINCTKRDLFSWNLQLASYFLPIIPFELQNSRFIFKIAFDWGHFIADLIVLAPAASLFGATNQFVVCSWPWFLSKHWDFSI